MFYVRLSNFVCTQTNLPLLHPISILKIFKHWKIVLKIKCVHMMKYYLVPIGDLKGYVNGERHDIGQLKDN